MVAKESVAISHLLIKVLIAGTLTFKALPRVHGTSRQVCGACFGYQLVNR